MGVAFRSGLWLQVLARLMSPGAVLVGWLVIPTSITSEFGSGSREPTSSDSEPGELVHAWDPEP